MLQTHREGPQPALRQVENNWKSKLHVRYEITEIRLQKTPTIWSCYMIKYYFIPIEVDLTFDYQQTWNKAQNKISFLRPQIRCCELCNSKKLTPTKRFANIFYQTGYCMRDIKSCFTWLRLGLFKHAINLISMLCITHKTSLPFYFAASISNANNLIAMFISTRSPIATTQFAVKSFEAYIDIEAN